MRKLGVMILFTLILFSSLVLADINSTDVDNAYDCLENKISDCSTLSTSEVALSILATPDEHFDECVTNLETRKTGDLWGNVKDSALSIMALDHAGKETTDSEAALEALAKDSTDLTWYVQIDSDDETTCRVFYDNQTYSDIQINEDKTLSSGAGTCLTRANNNYFLSVDPSCYEKTINVECENDFIVALAYKYSGQSSVLNLLDETQSSSAYGSVGFEITSKCFGEGANCDFESSAWAVYTLLKQGKNVEDYLPYLIATSDSNSQYLASAFLYEITAYDSYATELLREKTTSGYWDVSGSPYGRFYDSALATLALGNNNQNIDDTLAWLYFNQDSNGCWQDSIIDTAMVLWATEQRAGRSPGGGGSVSYCEDVENTNYSCVTNGQCSGQILDNFFCSGTQQCCTEPEQLSSCTSLGGTFCGAGQSCVGAQSASLEGLSCCVGQCVDGTTLSVCETAGNTCESSCGASKTEVSLACDDSGDKCCRASTTPPTPPTPNNSIWWIWLIVVVLLLAIGFALWFYRDKIFHKKGEVEKGMQGGMPPRGPGIPPRGRPGYRGQMAPPPRRPVQGIPPKPGFPPVRRQL